MSKPMIVLAVNPLLRGRRRAKAIREAILKQLDQRLFGGEFRRVRTVRGFYPRHVVLKQLKRLEAQGVIEGRGEKTGRGHRLKFTPTAADPLQSRAREENARVGTPKDITPQSAQQS